MVPINGLVVEQQRMGRRTKYIPCCQRQATIELYFGWWMLDDVGSKTHGNLGKSHKHPACAKMQKPWPLTCRDASGDLCQRFRLAQSINSKIENSTSAQNVSKVKKPRTQIGKGWHGQ